MAPEGSVLSEVTIVCGVVVECWIKRMRERERERERERVNS